MPTQPDPSFLLEALDIALPPTGFYDAPDPAAFEPLVQPKQGEGRGPCVFAYFAQWQKGVTLHLPKDDFRCCGGAARSLSRIETRGRDEFLHFLAIEEGLKESEELMGEWIDANPGYRQEHPHLFMGPLKPDSYACLKTVTFWVNADQMSALTLGAQYHARLGDPPPVVARFGAGCGQMVAVFDDLQASQAQIGATDIAMRDRLPAGLLAFTVTRPLFERLCAFDETSYLSKPFLARLKKARGGSLA
jgi:hypothetical protein